MNARRKLLLTTLALVVLAAATHLLLRSSLETLLDQASASQAQLAAANGGIRHFEAVLASARAPKPAPASAKGSPPTTLGYVDRIQETISSHPQIRAMYMKARADTRHLFDQPILAQLGYDAQKTEAYYAINANYDEAMLDLDAAATKQGLSLKDPLLQKDLQQIADDHEKALQAYFGSDRQTWDQLTAAGGPLNLILSQTQDPTYTPQEQAALRTFIAQHQVPGTSGPASFDWDAIAAGAKTILQPSHVDTFTTATQWYTVFLRKNAMTAASR